MQINKLAIQKSNFAYNYLNIVSKMNKKIRVCINYIILG